ncbi:hypothetical protein GLOIN_2v1776801 [Rhizophagus irregularis DAOM 181602=DAOM 197198]|nr:hypothetical protein GLOIN_2v1776801 [Rhizophagus irregularis DAOM 181602=DAOM 197198]
MYQRPNFEDHLKKWTNQHSEICISDIYNGKIWKEFPSRLDSSNSFKFFTSETADSHLGIMINLNWFQPFESSSYSCGAIYGVICNLPCEIRFKKENMLVLGLLPGPHEVKLHKINHYLAPIVDDLLELWENGFDLPSIARKLCGHISALAGCHRCHKRADGEEGQRANFGGFDDMDEWFREKDLAEYRRNAMIWKYQRTKENQNKHDLLDDNDRAILTNFVRACYLLVSQIIDENRLNKAHNQLLKVTRLIEDNYGPEMIMPNIYLSLHISECCRDYGPVYLFWCYSFERMNGILSSFLNSYRNIESELLRIIMQSWRLDNLISDQSNNVKLTEGLKLVQSRPTTGSLAAYDKFELDELFRFRQIHSLEIENTIAGSEPFPGEMLTPKKLTRIQIGAKIFRSANSPRYSKNSFIIAKFVQENESVEIFSSQVQYYIEHEINLPGSKQIHYLAYVRWFLPAQGTQKRFHCQIDDNDQLFLSDLFY